MLALSDLTEFLSRRCLASNQSITRTRCAYARNCASKLSPANLFRVRVRWQFFTYAVQLQRCRQRLGANARADADHAQIARAGSG